MVGECSLWTVVEPAICLFAACLPTLRPLIPRGANIRALTTNTPEKPSPYDLDAHSPDRGGLTKPSAESRSNTWGDEGTPSPSNVAYAESYHPLDTYGRAFNHVRSSFNPNRSSQEVHVAGSFTNQQSWLEEPETPPTGIMVRNEVLVEDGYSPKPQ